MRRSETKRGRKVLSGYLLALCGSVATVFGVAGYFVYRGAQTLAEKAEDQLATELRAVRSATERSFLDAIDELEILASQPVMSRIFDDDADSTIYAALKYTARASDYFHEIECVSLDGRVVASTVPARTGALHALEGTDVDQEVRGIIGLVGRDVEVTVPIIYDFRDSIERIGFLHARVNKSALLYPHEIEWVSIVDADGGVVIERGDRPTGFARQSTAPDPEVVVRSAAMRLPTDVLVDSLSVWVATPYNTLFGHSLALKSKVLWVGTGSALVLVLLMLTFLGLEGRYSSRLRRHARELERKNEALHRSEEGLREQSRLAQAASHAKSEFLSTMSHELRTPMNAIIGMTGLLLETRLDEDQSDFAETVQGSASNLLSIIDDVLDFSKIEAGRLTFDVAEHELVPIVEDAVDLVAHAADEAELELTCIVRADVPDRVHCDAGRVRQILINLLGNALKFTTEGEVRLTVSLAGKEQEAERIRFAVSDTGIGIAEEELEIIFDSFSQADASATRRFGGTGLGLAISKRLVEGMDGEIEVESELGVGSTFAFSLPLERAATRGAARHPPFIRVFVADPSEAVRESLAESLRSWGLEVVTAPVARGHALDGFDLLLLGEGVSAGATPDTFMVRVTSRRRRARIEQARERALEPLMKPVRRSELRARVEEAAGLAGGSDEWRGRIPGSSDSPTRKRVLVAEDNAESQKYVARLVEKLGYACDLVGDGQGALDAAQLTDHALILMDIQMPGMDGLEAIRRLRELQDASGRRVPILVVTANAMREDLERSLAAGADGHLTKPVAPKELRQAIEEWIEDDRAAHSAVEQPLSRPAERSKAPEQEAAWILVAEDNLVNQRLIKHMVEKMGFQCEVAANGREAVEAYGLMEFAAVLMDVRMPEMDGLQATTAIRELEHDLGRHTPILAVSANSSAEDRVRGHEAGMDDYLGKPVKPAELEAAIRRWIDKNEQARDAA